MIRIVFFALMMCVTGVAGAQDRELTDEQRLNLETARTFMDLGQQHFEAHRYDEAIAAFTRALELSAGIPGAGVGARAQVLYNIALCHERAGRTTEAIAGYRQYLELAPTSADREAVEARLRGLEPQQQQAADDPETTPQPEAEPVSQNPVPTEVEVALIPDEEAAAPGLFLGRTWTWIAAGTSVLLAGGGVVSWLVVRNRFDDYLSSCGATARGCEQDQIDDIHRGVFVTNLLFGASAVSLAIGAALFFLEGGSGEEPDTAAGLRLTLTPNGANVTGVW